MNLSMINQAKQLKAKLQGVVEATDYLVASPTVSNDLVQVRKDMDDETKKDKKSIAYLALAQAKLIEDLTQRVEKLEQVKLQNRLSYTN